MKNNMEKLKLTSKVILDMNSLLMEIHKTDPKDLGQGLMAMVILCISVDYCSR